MSQGYLKSNLTKIEGQISHLEKDYKEFKLQYNKQILEEMFIQRAVKTTIQYLYDKGFFDKCSNADKVLENFSFTTRRGPDLVKINDDIQCFCS